MCSFLNKFYRNIIRRFLPHGHLNNVSTLRCESSNARRARVTIELLKKDTPELIPR